MSQDFTAISCWPTVLALCNLSPASPLPNLMARMRSQDTAPQAV